MICKCFVNTLEKAYSLTNLSCNMNQLSRRLPLLFALLFSAVLIVPGCQVIGDIFKAGVWVGIIIVIIVLALIFGVARMFK